MKTTLSESALDDVVHATMNALKHKGIVIGDHNACDLNDVIASFLTENAAIEIEPDNTASVPDSSLTLSFNVSLKYEHIEGGTVDPQEMQALFEEGIEEVRACGGLTNETIAATDLFILRSEA